MRTIYLGTSDFAAAILQRLAVSDSRPQLVITRPDRPRGRGRRLTSPPVAELARELELPLIQPESLHAEAVLAQIAAARPDYICICAYGALIKEPLLSDYVTLNVHPSLLPRWRGAAPIERAIMAGDQYTGVSIMRITAGLDSGPVALQRREAIRADDTYGTLATRLIQLGGDLLLQALAESPVFVSQDESAATYAAKLQRQDRLLDPTQPASVLERQVRALTPHIGALLERPEGQLLGIHQVAIVELSPPPPPPGVLADRQGQLVLGCGGGSALSLCTLQPAGGKRMQAADYLRGYQL